jgi:hypothetical protein
MTEPNPHRAEVALPFGDGRLILRCSYGSLAKLLPLLFDAPDAVRQRRREWLKISQEALGVEPPPIERMEWHHHLIGAVAATEVDTVARAIAILAEEHHPGLTVEQVAAESPSWGLLSRAFFDLARLFHWRPGEEPTLTQEVAAGGPFDLGRLLAALSRSRRRTASARPNSGA